MQIPKLNALSIPYLVKPRRSNKRGKLAMSFLTDGTLSIRYSNGMREDDIIQFVNNHMDWIKKQFEKRKLHIRTFQNGEKYLYLGKEFSIVVYQSKHPDIVFNEDTMIIYSKSLELNDIETVVNNWKDSQCELVFHELLHEAFPKVSSYLKKYPTLKMKNYQIRWGCCYPKRDLIILNRSLIHVPLPLIRYVVYHELVHFIHPNHSPKFHSFLEQILGNERMLKKELAKYRADYH